MKRIINRVHQAPQSDLGFVLLLALISTLAFGIFIPFVGLYWDDWIWKFFSHAYSSSYLLWQPVDRPLAGSLHVVLNSLFGDRLYLWQLGNLFFRWANAAALFWMLRKALPEGRQIACLSALFFLLYPGFSEQWISIAFIHHLVPMALLWISFGLMFGAMDAVGKAERVFQQAISILLAMVVMLTTEYFYGAEIFRMVLVGYAVLQRQPGKKWLEVVKNALGVWWLYGLLSAVMVIWRSKVGVTEGATYNLAVAGMFEKGFTAGLGEFFEQVAIGIYSAAGNVFLSLFKFPTISVLGQVKTLTYYLLLVGTFALGWWVFRAILSDHSQQRKWLGLELAILGLLGLIFGGVPFWAAGLQYYPGFPNDRLGLSMMLGWSLLLVGLLLMLTSRKAVAVTVSAFILAFCMGANFLSGTEYVQSWEDQQDFWRQFVARIPALKPGTVVISTEIPAAFMSDLSFMAALNWLYDAQPEETGMDYGLFYGDSRAMFQTVEQGMPVEYHRRMVNFSSDLDHALVLIFRSNNCLYVFDPLDGPLNPNSNHIDPQFVALSNPDQIDLTVEKFDSWPKFFSPVKEDYWCSYYERGELELQRGNFGEVARIGDQAWLSGARPKRSWERAPFIEGYAMTGRWDDAFVLTQEVVSFPVDVTDLLCSIWGRVDASTPSSPEKTAALHQVNGILDCGE